MIKLSDVIIDFKDSLILLQLDTKKAIPLTAFNNFEDIKRFCNKYNKSLVWHKDELVVTNV